MKYTPRLKRNAHSSVHRTTASSYAVKRKSRSSVRRTKTSSYIAKRKAHAPAKRRLTVSFAKRNARPSLRRQRQKGGRGKVYTRRRNNRSSGGRYTRGGAPDEPSGNPDGRMKRYLQEQMGSTTPGMASAARMAESVRQSVSPTSSKNWIGRNIFSRPVRSSPGPVAPVAPTESQVASVELPVELPAEPEHINLCFLADTYKACHWRMYKPSIQYMISYIEPRKCRDELKGCDNNIVYFGLQALLKKYFENNRVTMDDIIDAQTKWNAHILPGAGIVTQNNSHIGFNFNLLGMIELSVIEDNDIYEKITGRTRTTTENVPTEDAIPFEEYLFYKHNSRGFNLKSSADLDIIEFERTNPIGLQRCSHGWLDIVLDCDGKVPLSVKTIREGTIVQKNTPLYIMWNSRPKYAWLPGFFETILMHIWHPISVATNSYQMMSIYRQEVDLLRANANFEEGGAFSLTSGYCEGRDFYKNFALHDFGYRGVSSKESAGLGGLAHLLNSEGTDTIAAVENMKKYYGKEMNEVPTTTDGNAMYSYTIPNTGYAGSLPASEHSIMTSYGMWGELNGIEQIFLQYRSHQRNTMHTNAIPPVAIVCDSYNIFRVVLVYLPIIISRNPQLFTESPIPPLNLLDFVIRPDSGEPLNNIIMLPILISVMKEITVNNKKVKDYFIGDGDSNADVAFYSKIRLHFIQGDGIKGSSFKKMMKFFKYAREITFNSNAETDNITQTEFKHRYNNIITRITNCLKKYNTSAKQIMEQVHAANASITYNVPQLSNTNFVFTTYDIIGEKISPEGNTYALDRGVIQDDDGDGDDNIIKFSEKKTTCPLQEHPMLCANAFNFGSGGGLLQTLNRDSLSFAFKACMEISAETGRENQNDDIIADLVHRVCPVQNTAGNIEKLNVNNWKFTNVQKQPCEDPNKASLSGYSVLNYFASEGGLHSQIMNSRYTPAEKEGVEKEGVKNPLINVEVFGKDFSNITGTVMRPLGQFQNNLDTLNTVPKTITSITTNLEPYNALVDGVFQEYYEESFRLIKDRTTYCSERLLTLGIDERLSLHKDDSTGRLSVKEECLQTSYTEHVGEIQVGDKLSPTVSALDYYTCQLPKLKKELHKEFKEEFDDVDAYINRPDIPSMVVIEESSSVS